MKFQQFGPAGQKLLTILGVIHAKSDGFGESAHLFGLV